MSPRRIVAAHGLEQSVTARPPNVPRPCRIGRGNPAAFAKAGSACSGL